jgi:hypothetical protein
MVCLVATISVQYGIDESARARPKVMIWLGIFIRELDGACQSPPASLGGAQSLAVRRRAKTKVVPLTIVPIPAARTSQFGPTAMQGRDKPSPLELRCGNAMSGYFWTDVVFCIVSQVRITHGELDNCSFPGSLASTHARRYCCSLTGSQYGLAPWFGCDSGVVFDARRGLPWSY